MTDNSNNNLLEDDREEGLTIGIVGAGIVGLTAAIALRRAGHDVEVFERSEFRNEVGAAVTMPPNGMKILMALGVDVERSRGDECVQCDIVDAETLRSMSLTDFSGDEEKYGAPWIFWHRADLHAELRLLATMEEGSGKPVVIRLASDVTNVEANGSIMLANGSTLEKDVVVVADGVHARFNDRVTNDTRSLIFTDRAAFRGLVPFEKLLEDPQTKASFDGRPNGFFAPANMQDGTIFVTYPCRGRTLLNVACVTPNKADTDNRDEIEWHHPATQEDVIECIKTFNTTVQAIARKLEQVALYNTAYRPPLQGWTKGKIILVGDAAHLMLPTHAQAAAIGIEDAGVLAEMLKGVNKTVDISDILRKVQDICRPRASATQIFSNGFYGQDFEGMTKEIRQFFLGPLPPLQMPPYADTWREWFCGTDAVQMAKESKGMV